MSGLESEFASMWNSALLLGTLYFLIGCVTRGLVAKIDRALAMSASISTILTLLFVISDVRNGNLHNILAYLVLFAIGTTFSQLGNVVTGMMVDFLNKIRNG